jgi:hypothetical protein
VRAAKTDSNQSEIVATLKAAGAKILSLAAVGRGVPDLLVFVPTVDPELIAQTAERLGGVYFLAEIKVTKGKLSPRQIDWHKAWGDSAVDIVRSGVDALRLIGR